MFKNMFNLSQGQITAMKFFFGLGLFGVISLWLSFNFFIEFSAFFVGIIKYFIAIVLFWLIDTIALKEVDTIDLIKKEPIAYAIFLLSNAILISFCISTS